MHYSKKGSSAHGGCALQISSWVSRNGCHLGKLSHSTLPHTSQYIPHLSKYLRLLCFRPRHIEPMGKLAARKERVKRTVRIGTVDSAAVELVEDRVLESADSQHSPPSGQPCWCFLPCRSFHDQHLTVQHVLAQMFDVCRPACWPGFSDSHLAHPFRQ